MSNVVRQGTGIILEDACPCCDIKPRMFVWTPLERVGACKRCYLPCDMSQSDAPPISPEWLPAFTRYWHTTERRIFQPTVWGVAWRITELEPEVRIATDGPHSAEALALKNWLNERPDLWPKPPAVSSIRVFECVRGPDGRNAFCLAFPMEDPRPVDAITIEADQVAVGQCVSITVGTIE